MEKNYKFSNITERQLKQMGVQALADRPNAAQQYGQSNLSPAQLKLWFDKLATLNAEKINELQDAISGGDAAKYIGLALEGYTTFDDLLNAIQDGRFAAELLKLYPNDAAFEVATLQDIIYGIAESFASTEEKFEEFDRDKVEKNKDTGSYRRAYAVNKAGEQVVIPVSEAPVAEAVASYSAEGNLKTAMPTESGHAVNLGYINELRKHMGAGVTFIMDPETYIISINVLNPSGDVIYSTSLDLPLESMLVSGSYENGVITLTLQNGDKMEIPVSNIVNGLVTQAAHDKDIADLNQKVDNALAGYIADVYNLVGGDYVDYS